MPYAGCSWSIMESGYMLMPNISICIDYGVIPRDSVSNVHLCCELWKVMDQSENEYKSKDHRGAYREGTREKMKTSLIII